MFVDLRMPAEAVWAEGQVNGLKDSGFADVVIADKDNVPFKQKGRFLDAPKILDSQSSDFHCFHRLSHCAAVVQHPVSRRYCST